MSLETTHEINAGRTYPPFACKDEFLGDSPLPHPRLYDAVKSFATSVLYRGQPIILSGQENVPTDPATRAVIAPTHGGVGDIAATGLTFPNGRINFLSHTGIMGLPGLGRTLREFGTLTLTKGNISLDPFQEASKRTYYKKDHMLAIYPEGILREGYTIGKIGSGAVILACTNAAYIDPDGNPVEADMQIIPVGIYGPEKNRYFPWKTPLITHVNEPITVPFIDATKESRPGREYRFGRQDIETIRGINDELRKSMQNALDVAISVHDNYLEVLADITKGKKPSRRQKLLAAALIQVVLNDQSGVDTPIRKTKQNPELDAQAYAGLVSQITKSRPGSN